MLPSTSLWGVYSETFIRHYNIPLAHSFTRLYMFLFLCFSHVHPALFLFPLVTVERSNWVSWSPAGPVSLKESSSVAQWCQWSRPKAGYSCRWQVTAKHAYMTLPMWFWMKRHCKVVYGWMVYTEPAPKRQHFTWYQPCNNQSALSVHHFLWILIMRAMKGCSHSFRITCDMCAVSLLESRE